MKRGISLVLLIGLLTTAGCTSVLEPKPPTVVEYDWTYRPDPDWDFIFEMLLIPIGPPVHIIKP
jgi:hypothetical protein